METKILKQVLIVFLLCISAITVCWGQLPVEIAKSLKSVKNIEVATKWKSFSYTTRLCGSHYQIKGNSSNIGEKIVHTSIDLYKHLSDSTELQKHINIYVPQNKRVQLQDIRIDTFSVIKQNTANKYKY